MVSTALERLESLLESRKLAQTLTSRDAPASAAHPQTLSTGVQALDTMLGGGWRQGEVSEIVGTRSSGRTSLLISTLAAAISRGGIVGLVDAFDRFDPISAARGGLDLERVLWIRGAALTLEAAGVGSDRGLKAYRDDVIWKAVRALDLIVRAGGFAVAALDLADVPAVRLRGLPMTTWMRLAHANEGRDTVCLLVGDAAMGRSARGASVRLEAVRRWTGTTPQSRRFAGFDIHAQIVLARAIGEGQSCWMARTDD